MNTEEKLAWLIDEGVNWIRSQQETHRGDAREISNEERSALNPYFEVKILDLARVKIVPVLENPPFMSTLKASGFPATLDFSSASGMAFVDTIVVSERYRPPESHWISLIFHELVHVIQHTTLGLREFTRRYVMGWAQNGFDYYAIPLERDAYALQRRFEEDSGRPFSVEEEVQRRLCQTGYPQGLS